VRTVVPQYRRLAGPQYPVCAFASPVKRVTIGTLPTFPATTAAAARTANCASSVPRHAQKLQPSSRRGYYEIHLDDGNSGLGRW